VIAIAAQPATTAQETDRRRIESPKSAPRIGAEAPMTMFTYTDS
jgi:hypothetical protein